MSKVLMELTVNGQRHELAVEPSRTLLELLRLDLGLTGTKQGCGEGDCGACAVRLDDVVVNACLVLALEADHREVRTIEGVARGAELHPLQEAFVDAGAVQCGFCTPGMILSAQALLEHNPAPSAEEVRRGLSGNLCRCTGYQKIVEAVLDAAGRMQARRGAAAGELDGPDGHDAPDGHDGSDEHDRHDRHDGQDGHDEEVQP